MSRWAVRLLDLLQAFNEVQPHIVHFSGHGSRKAELVLEDDDGNAKQVTEVALVRLFKNGKDNIRLVLLNACHSEAQARALSQQIECTLGMSVAIGDKTAILFACEIGLFGGIVNGSAWYSVRILCRPFCQNRPEF